MPSARFLLLVLTLGCDPFNNLGPSNVDGVYELVAVDNQLPYTHVVDGVATVTVTGSTLTLEPGGTGQLVLQYADQPQVFTADVDWVLHNGLVDLTFHSEGVTDPHPNCEWDEGFLRIAHSSGDDLLPGGIYLYRRRS